MLLLPYLEEKTTYAAYNFNEPWNGFNNRKLAERIPKVYVFHGFESPGNTTTNYLAVVGDETVWSRTRKVGWKDIKDGTSNTISIVENRGANVHWMEPRDLSLSDMDLKVDSPNGISSPYTDPAVLMAGGSLQRLHQSLRPEVLRVMFTIAGGEKVEHDGANGWQLLDDGRKRLLKETP